MESLRQEFELRPGNEVSQFEFVRIMQRNLPSRVYGDSSEAGGSVTANLVDLFKEIDMNGDGMIDWEEFTRFMIEKAALFKEQQTLDRLLSYNHNLTDEPSGHRHRNSIDCLTPLPKQFACIENTSPLISLYSARSGSLVTNMKCKAVPLSCLYIEPLQALVASCSDSTMVRFNVGESHHKVRQLPAVAPFQEHTFTVPILMHLPWQLTCAGVWSRFATSKGVCGLHLRHRCLCAGRHTTTSFIPDRLEAKFTRGTSNSGSLSAALKVTLT